MTREEIAEEMYNSVVMTLSTDADDKKKAPRWEQIDYYTQKNYLICADVAIKYIKRVNE